MTEQGKREWVIEGLEFTLEESGWDANAAYDQELMIQVVTEAIAMLKAQEPRVLSWEEIEFVYGNPYILEISVPDAGSWMEYGLYSHQGIRGNVDFINTTGRKRLEADYYGKTWRCWTSRPTDAQREAVKWE